MGEFAPTPEQQAIFDKNLGSSGIKVEQPEVDAY